jgi:hypothetical protein
MPTEVNVQGRPEILLGDAGDYLAELNLDWKEYHCTRGEGGPAVSEYSDSKVAPDGSIMKCRDWRLIDENGDTTYGGKGLYEEAQARRGRTLGDCEYRYSVNKKGRGAVTASGFTRFFELQQSAQDTATGGTNHTAAANTLPPLCQAIPIALDPQDCFTATDFGDDETGVTGSQDFHEEGRTGVLFRTVQGQKAGQYIGLDKCPTRWTNFARDSEKLAIVKKGLYANPTLQFVAPPNQSRFVYNTTGYVVIDN